MLILLFAALTHTHVLVVLVAAVDVCQSSCPGTSAGV